LSAEKLNGSQLDGRRIQVEVASAGRKGANESHVDGRRPTRAAERREPRLESATAEAAPESRNPDPASTTPAAEQAPKKRSRHAAAVDETLAIDPAINAVSASHTALAPPPSARAFDPGENDSSAVLDAVTSVRRARGATKKGARADLETADESVPPRSGLANRTVNNEAVSPPPQPEPLSLRALPPNPGLTRDRTLYIFGLPESFDKKRLWKRVKKLNGSCDLAFPIILPGNAQCCVASVTFTGRPQREKAATRLTGHSLLGHALAAWGADQLLARKEAFTKVCIAFRPCHSSISIFCFDFAREGCMPAFQPPPHPPTSIH
jgi:hypothetical protein